MGYFSNGTEGEAFYFTYCEKCVHNEEDKMCPVWALHHQWNYEQFPDSVEEDAIEEIAEQQVKKDALDTLITRGENGQECKLFFPQSKVKGKPDPNQLSLLDTMFNGKIKR